MFKEHFSLVLSLNVYQNLFCGKIQTCENEYSVSQQIFPAKNTAEIAGTLSY